MERARRQPDRRILLTQLDTGLRNLAEKRKSVQIVPYSHVTTMIKAAQHRHGEDHVYDHH